MYKLYSYRILVYLSCLSPNWVPRGWVGLSGITQNPAWVQGLAPKPNPKLGWVGLGPGPIGFWRSLVDGKDTSSPYLPYYRDHSSSYKHQINRLNTTINCLFNI